MKANKPERRPPFELPTHKSHRGKRDAERLIAGRNESESLLDVSFDECTLFFAAQAVVKKTFSHPLDRLPSMGGEDEHAIRRQVLGKKAQEIRPLLTIQVREQRSAPDQVEALVEADAPDILVRINRRRVKLRSAKVHPVTVEIAGSQLGMGKNALSIRQTRPWPHGRSRIDVGAMWVVVSADLLQSSADLPTSKYHCLPVIHIWSLGEITVLYSSSITLIDYTPLLCISVRYIGGTIPITPPTTVKASKMNPP